MASALASPTSRWLATTSPCLSRFYWSAVAVERFMTMGLSFAYAMCDLGLPCSRQFMMPEQKRSAMCSIE